MHKYYFVVEWQRIHRVHCDLDAMTARIYSFWNYGETKVTLKHKDRPLLRRGRFPFSKHVHVSLSIFLLLPNWSIGHSWNTLFQFSFLNLLESVELLGRVSASRKAATYTKRINAFESTILVFEWSKQVHASDCTATVISHCDQPLTFLGENNNLGHDSRGDWKEEWLCCRRLAAI
jgi:hypothetical protein